MMIVLLFMKARRFHGDLGHASDVDASM